METYTCPKCSVEYREGDKFCQTCGCHLQEERVPEKLFCTQCGKEFSAGTMFCDVDGTKLPTMAGAFTGNNFYARASLGSRFLASLLDSLVISGLSIPTAICYFLGVITLYDNRHEGISLLIFAAFLYLIPLTYFCLKDGLGQGQSLGKRAMGLMVVHLPSNRPCSFGQSFLRNLIMTLLGLLPFVGWAVEPFMVLTDEEGRRLGDKAAGTQVIEKESFYN